MQQQQNPTIALFALCAVFFFCKHDCRCNGAANERNANGYDFGCIKVLTESRKHKNAVEFVVDNEQKVYQHSNRSRSPTKRLVFHKASHGYVISSGYPHVANDRQKCAAMLEAPEVSGLVLQLSLVDVDLERRYSRSGQCLWDYLVLTIIDRDGREHSSERICGTELPEPVRTMQSRARVFFFASASAAPPDPALRNHLSAGSRHRRGFKMRYEFVPEATILASSSFYFDSNPRFRSECGGVNSPTALSGEIHSPGFPSTYPSNVTCYWLLRVAANRRLYIRILDLELSPTVAECDRASLHLLDGYRHDLLQTKQQREEESWASAAVASTGSKRGANIGAAAADVDFCGSSGYYAEEGRKSYLSDSNRVVVKFATRAGPAYEQLVNYERRRLPVGFRLLWTEIESLVATSSDLPDNPQLVHTPIVATASQCSGFVCLGGSFCVDSADAVCVERSRLCINETLRCDGVANCAENDESDEAFCYTRNPVSLTAFALLLLALIAILLTIGFCVLKHLLQQQNASDINNNISNSSRNGKQQHKRRRRHNQRTNTKRDLDIGGARCIPDIRMQRASVPTVSGALGESGELVVQPDVEEQRANLGADLLLLNGNSRTTNGGTWRGMLTNGNVLIRDLDVEQQLIEQHEQQQQRQDPQLLPCFCAKSVQNAQTGNIDEGEKSGEDDDDGSSSVWKRRHSQHHHQQQQQSNTMQQTMMWTAEHADGNTHPGDANRSFPLLMESFS